ncbi:Transcription factor [Macleaya cordata]|uniref:Transcription factor n=1 Tax=Macleaya cordata TaxID=56857 RepID=A0A200Q6Q5_MACCD|nr:Transcription factor [Macleaya cordata]
MGRAKLNMELIAKEKSRYQTYIKRKKGLKKKIYEFSTLCGVDACMIIYGLKQGDRPIEPEIWPNNLDEAHRIIKRYHQVGKDDRGKRSLDLFDFFEDRKKKIEDELVKLRRRNGSLSWDDRVNGFTVDQLRQLNDTLASKMEFIDARIALMKGQECLSDGTTGVVKYSHETQNQNPCYMPSGTGGNNLHGTTWREDDILHTQPLRYAAPLDQHRSIMTMDNYPSDHPTMVPDNTHMMTPMMAMNGYDYGHFSGGPIGNFSHPMVKNHPFLYDQTVMPSMEDMEFTNRGSSTFRMQPMMMPTPSIMQPCMMPMGSSSQMHPQPSIMQPCLMNTGSSSQMQNQPFNDLFDVQDPLINKYKRGRFL